MVRTKFRYITRFTRVRVIVDIRFAEGLPDNDLQVENRLQCWLHVENGEHGIPVMHEAADAYEAMSLKLNGEFALMNLQAEKLRTIATHFKLKKKPF